MERQTRHTVFLVVLMFAFIFLLLPYFGLRLISPLDVGTRSIVTPVVGDKPAKGNLGELEQLLREN